MNIYCIGTGSSGNCYLVEYEPEKMFMLDCGLPSSYIDDFLSKYKIHPNWIKFCLISHLHIDHLHDSGFLNKYSIDCYFSERKKENKPQSEIKNSWKFDEIQKEKEFSPRHEQRIKIIPYHVPHDGYNYAYKITLPNGKKMMYMTDFGNIKKGNVPIFFDKINYWLIECNYGVGTLEENMSNCLDGNKLKIQKRTRDDQGHCSNVDCYKYLESQVGGLVDSDILLIHKSEDNLIPERDYKDFKYLDCKSCKPIKPGIKYTFN